LFLRQKFNTAEVKVAKATMSKYQAAMEELEEEMKESQSLECNDSNNILSIATQMLKFMECIEKLLQ
jgi:hypothetical protein